VNAWGPYRPPTRRQPVGWGALHETPPVVTAPVVRESPADWLFNGILRPAWAYRLELVLIALVAAAYLWLGDRVGRAGAERLIVAAALVVAMITWTREPLAHALFWSHLRRRWALACRHAELATPNDRIPRITRCQLTRAGEQLRVRVPAGSQGARPGGQAERIAAFLAVREVRVTREPASARHARVIVLRRIRWPTRPRCPGHWPRPTGCRCGSPSRSVSTRTAPRSPSPCPSATSCSAASPAPARATSSSSWSPWPPSTPRCA
jgi:hypothetical protein